MKIEKEIFDFHGKRATKIIDFCPKLQIIAISKKVSFVL